MSHEKNYVIKELTEEMEDKFLAKHEKGYGLHRDPTGELIILMDHRIETLENRVNDLSQALLIINKLMRGKTNV